ncbi:MAG: hypothetical protein LAQ69_31535 [Acidobacteriia bacterium]|nr:hypothetical protein [Terriglobia bacterium]
MAAEEQNHNDRRETGNAEYGDRQHCPRGSTFVEFYPEPAVRPAGMAAGLHQPLGHQGDIGRLRIVPAGEMQPASEPVPIWLAALLATRCQAIGKDEDHAVRWICVSGRALYTNAGAHTEWIDPLGVSLERGHTVAVYWAPGESAYRVEVCRQYNQCA